MTSIPYKNLDDRLSNLEHQLNTLGYIPFVSSLTGTGRILYGSVESLVARVAFTFKSCQYLLTGNREHRNEAAANYWYAIHGDLNVARGSLEFIPLIGNVATILYDKGLRLRGNYTYEELEPRTLPIFEPAAVY